MPNLVDLDKLPRHKRRQIEATLNSTAATTENTPERERVMAALSVAKRIAPDASTNTARKAASDILCAFLRDPEQKAQEQFALALDIATSCPPFDEKDGDAANNAIRKASGEALLAYIDPEAAAMERAWTREKQ